MRDKFLYGFIHLDVPETPSQLNVTSTSYSSIGLKWQPGFDGGWPQSYWVSIDSSLAKETNASQYTLTRKSRRKKE
jgi:hypothetical protein